MYQTTVTVVQDTTKSDSWRSSSYINGLQEASDWIRRVMPGFDPAQVAIIITKIGEDT